MSRVPIEPNNLPSSPALDTNVTSANASSLSARACAATNCSAIFASSSARRASNVSMLALVAGTALPCGKRKLRAKPDLTTTCSPGYLG